MQKVEYKTKGFLLGLGDEISDCLNEQAERGWEVVTILDYTDYYGQVSYKFLFKKYESK